MLAPLLVGGPAWWGWQAGLRRPGRLGVLFALLYVVAVPSAAAPGAGREASPPAPHGRRQPATGAAAGGWGITHRLPSPP